MKTSLKVLAVVGIMLAVMVSGLYQSSALAHDPAGMHAGNPGGGHGHWPMKKMMAALGLSGEQKQEVKKILKQNQPLIRPLINQLITERRDLRALMQADTIDEAAIRAQAARVSTVQSDLAVQRAHIHQALRQVLTPEQLQKFKELQAKRDSKIDDFISRKAKHLQED